MTGRARVEHPLPPPLSVSVEGIPAAQGSKRHVGNGRLIEQSKRVKPWRTSVRVAAWDAVLNAGHPGFPAGTPVQVEVTFVMRRPAATPKRRTPPAVKRPDVDKLSRACLDALSEAGVWIDDAQVVHLCAVKRIAEVDEGPGCHILIAAVQQPRGATNVPGLVSTDLTEVQRRSGGVS